MSKKAAVTLVIVLVVIGAAVLFFYDWQARRPEGEPLFGGRRDGNGCLGSAGYRWDSDLGACVRRWEIQGEAEERIARASAEHLTEMYGSHALTVVQIAEQPCEGCYVAQLEKMEKQFSVTLINWEIIEAVLIE